MNIKFTAIISAMYTSLQNLDNGLNGGYFSVTDGKHRIIPQGPFPALLGNGACINGFNGAGDCSGTTNGGGGNSCTNHDASGCVGSTNNGTPGGCGIVIYANKNIYSN